MKITLFPNTKTKDIHPDYRAYYKDEEGIYHNVAAGWIKNGKNGEYISLSIELDELDGYEKSQEEFKSQLPPKVDNPKEPETQENNFDDLPF